MSNPSVLDRYTSAISPDAKILGRLAWFSVEETTLAHTELLRHIDDVGLGRRFAPKPPADVDVFRRVTTAAKAKRVPNSDGTYSNFLVRDVSTEKTEVLRRLVIETVDAKGHRLSYDEAYDLIFDKETGRVWTVPLTGQATVADDLVRNVQSDYLAQRGTVNADTLRTLTNRVFTAAHATSVRPTGAMYFTPISETPLVDALEALAERIPKMTVHTMDLVDYADAKQAKMVRSAVVDSAVAELDEMMAKGKDLLAEGAITAKRAAVLMSRGKELRAKAVAYSQVLDDNLTAMQFRLDLFDTQMLTIMSKVEV